MARHGLRWSLKLAKCVDRLIDLVSNPFSTFNIVCGCLHAALRHEEIDRFPIIVEILGKRLVAVMRFACLLGQLKILLAPKRGTVREWHLFRSSLEVVRIGKPAGRSISADRRGRATYDPPGSYSQITRSIEHLLETIPAKRFERSPSRLIKCQSLDDPAPIGRRGNAKDRSTTVQAMSLSLGRHRLGGRGRTAEPILKPSPGRSFPGRATHGLAVRSEGRTASEFSVLRYPVRSIK